MNAYFPPIEFLAPLAALHDKKWRVRGNCGLALVSLSTLRRMSTALSMPADAFLFGPSNETDQQDRTLELQILCSKLTRLSLYKFRAVKEIIDKLLKAFTME